MRKLVFLICGLAAVGAIYLGLLIANDFKLSHCRHGADRLGFGMLMYTSDYDDRFPISARWRTTLVPYSKEADNDIRCPFTEAAYTYAMDKNLSGIRMNDLEDANHVMPIFECDSDNPNAAGGPEMFVKRHHGRGTVFFMNEEAYLSSKFTPAKVSKR